MWEDLSLKEKAEMMRIGIQNGISDLNHIKEAYNEYSKGGYAKWKRQIYKHKGIDVDNDKTYDYEGFYKAHPNEAWGMLKEDPEYHFDDEFKTAYHPTFSTYSKYSGVKHPKFNPKGWEGGTWSNDNHIFTVSKDQYDNNRNDSLDKIIRYLEEEEDNGVVIKKWDGSYPEFEDGSLYGGVLPTAEAVAPYKGRKKALGGNIFEVGGPEDEETEEDNTIYKGLDLPETVVTPNIVDRWAMDVYRKSIPDSRARQLLHDYVRERVPDSTLGKNYFYNNLAKIIEYGKNPTVYDWRSLSEKDQKAQGYNYGKGIGRARHTNGEIYLDYTHPEYTPDIFMKEYIDEVEHAVNNNQFPEAYHFKALRPDPKAGQYNYTSKRYQNQNYHTPMDNEFNTHYVIGPRMWKYLMTPNSGAADTILEDVANNYDEYATEALRKKQQIRRDANGMIQEDFDTSKIPTRRQNIINAIDNKAQEIYEDQPFYVRWFSSPENYTEEANSELKKKFDAEMKKEDELRQKDNSEDKWWYNGDHNVPSRYTGKKVGMYGYGGQVNKFPLGGGILPWLTPEQMTEDNVRKLASGTSALGSAISMIPTPLTRGVGAALTMPATMFDVYDTYQDINNGANTSDYVVDGLNLAIDALPVLPIRLPKKVKFSQSSRQANKQARGAIAGAIEPTVLTAVPNLTQDLYNLFGPNYVDYIDNEGRPFKYSNNWDRYSVLLPDVVVKGKGKHKK